MTQDGGGSSFRRIPEVGALHAPTETKFDFSARSDDFGDFEDVKRRVSEAHEAEPTLVAATAATLRDEGSLVIEEGDEDAELLSDIRYNIAQGEFEIALELLADLLASEPAHLEGRYLEALCHFKKEDADPRKALRLIRPLLDLDLDQGLANEVGALRRALRRTIVPAEVDLFEANMARAPREAVARVREYAELFPEEGALAALLARGLALLEDFPAALEAAIDGASSAETERDLCSNLAMRLALHLRVPLAGEAVEAFKAGRYAEARRELARLEPRLRRIQVVEDFDAYLSGIQHLGPGNRVPPPRLDPVRTDGLYSLIAEADVNAALQLLTRERFSAAQQRLTVPMSRVPEFPWLNFVYALCLFVQGSELLAAAKAAEVAMRDPNIAQAGALRDAARDRYDAAIVNPLVKEFVAALESPKDLPSPTGNLVFDQALLGMNLTATDPLRTVRDRLRRLQPKLRDAHGKTVTANGTQVLRQLAELLPLRIGEVEVASLVQRFNDLARQLESGPYFHRDSIVRQLRSIKSDAQELSRRPQLDQRDRKLLSDLLGALNGIGL